MKKLLALAVVAAAAALYYYYSYLPGVAAAAAKTTARQTAKAERGDITITVSASGRIEPERSVDIKSKASGEVVQVFADVSDEVKQGMLLYKLDPTDEERSVARLTANLAMSRAKLEQTRLGVSAAEAKLEADTARANADVKSAQAEGEEFAARLRRAEQLYQQKVISREELDTAVTKAVQTESALANAQVKLEDLKVQAMELEKTRQEIHISEAQVDNDTVALADAQQKLKETEVFSPIDGVVSIRNVQEGLIVASGVSNVGGGTIAMQLIDLSRIYAIAAVDEADIAGVVPGIKAIVTADAYKDMEFSGKVVRVAATGVVESNVVTFDVKVEVESRRKNLLKPEMTTNVKFLVDERKNVVVVPAGAVVRRAAETPAGGTAVPASNTAPAGERPAGRSGRMNRSGGEGGGRVDYSRRESFVSVLKPDGTEEERRVQTGITDGYQIEIVSGLKEGEEVVLQQNADSKWAGQANRPPRMPRL